MRIKIQIINEKFILGFYINIVCRCVNVFVSGQSEAEWFNHGIHL